IDTNDAETLIYMEDQRVLASGNQYITLVIGATLTGKFSNSGRESLQGAYVSQKEYDNGCKLPGCVQVRLLIANSGSGNNASDQVAYASLVMGRILRAVQSDRTIVGVMGWSSSSSSFYVTTGLGLAHIPIVSPTPFFATPAKMPLYFFSVAPSNTSQ